ncbi:MAG: class I SAM-dependent methyltransferase [Steroidobacteraceae bacterium]
MLAYHQLRGRLGMGDLHPGGAPATAELLRLLAGRGVRRVLEVGAGIGNTALRMTELGWEVTALEPDPVLFRILERRLGSRARRESLAAHCPVEPYDAVVAESVLALLDVREALAQVHNLLKPAGYVAFVESVWAEDVGATQARAWHDQTLRLFGIPVGSRGRLTWQDWRRYLEECGFDCLCAERLPHGSAGHPATPDRRALIDASIRDPRLVVWLGRYRLRKRRVGMGGGALESWVFVGRSGSKAAR